VHPLPSERKCHVAKLCADRGANPQLAVTIRKQRIRYETATLLKDFPTQDDGGWRREEPLRQERERAFSGFWVTLRVDQDSGLSALRGGLREMAGSRAGWYLGIGHSLWLGTESRGGCCSPSRLPATDVAGISRGQTVSIEGELDGVLPAVELRDSSLC